MELRSFATETDGVDGESGSFAELEDGQLAIAVDVPDSERERPSSAPLRRRALGLSERNGGARRDEDGKEERARDGELRTALPRE